MIMISSVCRLDLSIYQKSPWKFALCVVCVYYSGCTILLLFFFDITMILLREPLGSHKPFVMRRETEEEKLFSSWEYYKGIQALQRSMYINKRNLDTTKTKEEINVQVNAQIMSDYVLPKYRKVIYDRKMREYSIDYVKEVSYLDSDLLNKREKYMTDSVADLTYLKITAQALLGATEKDFENIEKEAEKDAQQYIQRMAKTYDISKQLQSVFCTGY